MTSHSPGRSAVLAAVGALCFALGAVEPVLRDSVAGVPAVWLPTGLAVAAMLLYGRHVWPAVLGGVFLGVFAATGDPAASAAFALACALEAAIGAAIVDRVARGADAVRSAKGTFRFVAAAALVSTPFGASVASIGLALAAAYPWTNLPIVWLAWWLASLAGTLLLAPLLILWMTTPFEKWSWLKGLEAGLLVALVTIASAGVFGRILISSPQENVELLCVPVLLWAAFRFSRREVVTAAVLLSGAVLWQTLRGLGPLDHGHAVRFAQIYAGAIAILGVVLAAVVSDLRTAEAKLEQLATTDPLTGLANHRRLMDILRAEIARVKRTGRPFAVLVLDMNGLRAINDAFGHLAGNRALCSVADALRGTCRAIDTTARFGGDEFAVVLPETGATGGRRVAERVSQRLAMLSDGPQIVVSCGVAVCPGDGDSPTLLLRAADRALSDAKAGSVRGLAAAAAAAPELVVFES